MKSFKQVLKHLWSLRSLAVWVICSGKSRWTQGPNKVELSCCYILWHWNNIYCVSLFCCWSICPHVSDMNEEVFTSLRITFWISWTQSTVYFGAWGQHRQVSDSALAFELPISFDIQDQLWKYSMRLGPKAGDWRRKSRARIVMRRPSPGSPLKPKFSPQLSGRSMFLPDNWASAGSVRFSPNFLAFSLRLKLCIRGLTHT